MNKPKPDRPFPADGTDRLLREAFRTAYTPQSARQPEVFRRRVLQRLPRRRPRPLLQRLAAVLHWLADSPLWLWSGLLVCLFLRWRQALSLLLRLLAGELPLLSPTVFVPVLLLCATLAFLLREMILDLEAQMRR